MIRDSQPFGSDDAFSGENDSRDTAIPWKTAVEEIEPNSSPKAEYLRIQCVERC